MMNPAPFQIPTTFVPPIEISKSLNNTEGCDTSRNRQSAGRMATNTGAGSDDDETVRAVVISNYHLNYLLPLWRIL